MKFDVNKDFKTNQGLTVRIIRYIGNLGPDMMYPYYGYMRFGDDEPAFSARIPRAKCLVDTVHST